MKREGRIHKGVSIGAYSILIAFMLLLLWTVLRYPGNHLIPWQMALGVAAATVLLLAAGEIRCMPQRWYCLGCCFMWFH